LLYRLPHGAELLEGRLVGRYDRFIADVRLGNGRVAHTHCVDPGRMEGLVREGMRVWISRAPKGRKRKLKYTWELCEHDGALIGVNANSPNRIVEGLLEARAAPGMTRFDRLQREVAYADGRRADFCLLTGRKKHWVEVKNCQLVYPDGRGYFPDSVSERATHHVEALAERVRAGDRATVLFTVQRADAKSVRPSDLHDPTFAEACREARGAGVRFRAVRVVPTLDAYEVRGAMPVDLRPYGTKRQAAWRASRLPESGWKRRGPITKAATTS